MLEPSPPPGRRTSGIWARVGVGWGGVILSQTPKMCLQVNSSPRVCPHSRTRPVSRGGKHRVGTNQKLKDTKRNRCVLGAKLRRASKEREEKAGRRRAAGPEAGGLHHCSSPARKWAPNRSHHHGARAGLRFPRAFPERSGHGHRASSQHFANISSRARSGARARLPPPPPPSFCVLV